MGLFAELTVLAMALLAIAPSSPPKATKPLHPLVEALADVIQSREASDPSTPDSTDPSSPDPNALQSSIDRNIGIGMLHLPSGYRAVDGRCDLLVHFHGVPRTVSSALDDSGIQAAVLVINLGTASQTYEQQYSDSKALARTLVAVQNSLDRVLPEPCQIGRVALSAWSAGFAAVSKVLAYENNAKRVDAVLLADGLHARFRDKRQREIDDRGITSLIRFAQEAADGEKLMSVTHSSVETGDYASTTETASFILTRLGLSPRLHHRDDVPDMAMAYRADKRGFHVQGFRGSDAHAHCDHLHAFGKLLLPDLQARWGKP